MGSNDCQNTFDKLSMNKKALLIVLLLLAIIQFVYRGPLRAIRSSDDFSIVYISAKRWVQNENPYEHNRFMETWVASGGIPNKMPSTIWRPSVYPLTTFPFVAPLTLFNWNQAKIIWLFINLILFSIAICLLYKFFAIHVYSINGIIILISILILSPLNDAITQGNPVILSTSFLIFGIINYIHNNIKRSAIFTGISLAIKPQVAFSMLIYYFLKKEYKLIFICFVALLFFISLSIFNINTDIKQWFLSYQENINQAFQNGGANDPCNSLISHSIISFDYIVCKISKGYKKYYDILKYIITVFTIYFITIFKAKEIELKILQIIIINIIGLLFFYHRNPDAMVLIFLIFFIFGFTNKIFIKKYQKLLYILIIIPFLSGGPVHLAKLVEKGIVPKYISENNLWNIFIMPFKQWCLVIMLIILIYIFLKMSGENNNQKSDLRKI